MENKSLLNPCSLFESVYNGVVVFLLLFCRTGRRSKGSSGMLKLHLQTSGKEILFAHFFVFLCIFRILISLILTHSLTHTYYVFLFFFKDMNTFIQQGSIELIQF